MASVENHSESLIQIKLFGTPAMRDRITALARSRGISNGELIRRLLVLFNQTDIYAHERACLSNPPATYVELPEKRP